MAEQTHSDTVIFNDAPHDLPALAGRAWALLRQGVEDHHHPFHTGTLSSADPEGFPAGRTMVVRALDEAARRLSTQTDLRTAKAVGLRRDARASWVFWDADGCVQLQLAGRVRVRAGADDAVVRQQWEALSTRDRRSYCAARASSVEINTPAAAEAGTPDPETLTREASEEGLVNFAVLDMAVEIVEVLYLGKPDHFRARARYAPGAGPELSWLTP